MLRITSTQRRRIIAHRHLLDGRATDVHQVVQALVCLHATDPASVYLSVLARGGGLGVPDLRSALYDERSLVRWLAMRRTLFVFATTDIPLVQAAVSQPLAVTLRRRLIRTLHRNGSDPAISGDLGAWVAQAEADTLEALARRGDATGLQLGQDVPALRTFIPPRTPSDVPQNVTSQLLAMMSADGSIVRAVPVGSWTTRTHRWEAVERWFPSGIPPLDPHVASAELARRWLTTFGPALPEDLQWWTGWTKTTTGKALAALPLREVELDGATGIVLDDPDLLEEYAAPSTPTGAALLPALDPTAMGWKRRDWYLGVVQEELFDRAGNIGPTLWWDGRIVGSWAVLPDGAVRTVIRTDCGSVARAAIDTAAEVLRTRLDGTVVTPAVRTPLERSLSSVAPAQQKSAEQRSVTT